MSRKFLEDVEITAGVKITSGSPGADKVLTSDASGNATWEDNTGGSGITAAEAIAYAIALG